MNRLNATTTAPQTDDPMARMATEDREDWALLRLVVCVALATLALAVASTLAV